MKTKAKVISYPEWRNEGCPCGNFGCVHYRYDYEAQNCYGELSNGDPSVAECKYYVPCPHVVRAWAIEKIEETGKQKEG